MTCRQICQRFAAYVVPGSLVSTYVRLDPTLRAAHLHSAPMSVCFSMLQHPAYISVIARLAGFSLVVFEQLLPVNGRVGEQLFET